MINIETIKQDYENITAELKKAEQVLDWEKAGQIRKTKESYEKIIAKEQEIKETKERIIEAQAMLNKEKDSELLTLAKEEIEILGTRFPKLEKELETLLNQTDGNEEINESIIEIRAGAGGDEAGLFAANLFNMYSKYAESQNWEARTLSSNQTDIGGYKEIIFSIKGKNSFSKLKNEAGVHRVQRIPETEKSGRIHTSTVSVAILPKAKKSDIEIKSDDLQIDTYKSSGPGGQNVNKRETAIRITHLPTGIVVTSQNERNQAQNKENALSIIRTKVVEIQEQRQIEKIGSKRKDQVGQAMRAEKIRTYNFPQNRLTDHRIKKTWHNLDQVMAGELDEIISACG
ncbi:peptide chain release factor 1 [Patescibacteria group bacterium]|nr:peptide chain release factor 1 [Patescibacteria group bacterium]MBU4023245.1 peptide chain release factor 1 [Patescibacteria group bacterium]MBU4078516.1 peptide chain release factor 1 [Patescibacteria group bacterium]